MARLGSLFFGRSFGWNLGTGPRNWSLPLLLPSGLRKQNAWQPTDPEDIAPEQFLGFQGCLQLLDPRQTILRRYPLSAVLPPVPERPLVWQPTAPQNILPEPILAFQGAL